MKLLIMTSALMLGLSLNAVAQGLYGDDSLSEAGVAAPEYDNSRKDCNCRGPIINKVPGQNDANSMQIINAVYDRSKAMPEPTTAQ